jgi:hypothetical protein
MPPEETGPERDAAKANNNIQGNSPGNDGHPGHLRALISTSFGSRRDDHEVNQPSKRHQRNSDNMKNVGRRYQH